MDTNDLVKLLPPGYEQACFDKKAITRKRTIKNPLDLLRLILFYLSGNKSLIDVTHFALLSGIGKISDIAFMKKFIQCTDTKKNYVKPFIATVLQSRQSGSTWAVLQMKQ